MISDIVILAIGAGLLLFVGLYGLRSNWRATRAGQAVMGFFASLLLLALNSIATSLAHWYERNELLVLILEVFVLISIYWCIWVLFRSQQKSRRESAKEAVES